MSTMSEMEPGRRRMLIIGGVIAAAILAVVVLVVVTGGDDDDDPSSSTVTSTSTSTTATSTTASTSTTAPASAGDTSTAVWPGSGSEVRYDDPVDAAVGFAEDFIGFVDPVAGEFRQGDTRSGEVEIRPTADGPVTTVLVRQLTADDSWWVLGSATANIELESPAALAEVTSPVSFSGRSTAFEATVSVELRVDGRRPPLATGFVMGGANGEMGPFEGSLPFDAPGADAGALVLLTESGENGQPWEATVIRVRYGSSVTPVQACTEGASQEPDAAADELVVTVFFSCGDATGEEPVATYRTVPKTTAVLRASLEQLLAGPTPAEEAAGFRSWFSADTADLLDGVALSDGQAVVDVGDLRPVIPNASTSAGSQMLLSELDATVFQFPSVRSARYRIDGDCDAWAEWLQRDSCDSER